MTGRMTATAVLAITIILSAAMIPAQDSNPALTLQRAIDLVESQGDWNSAIPLFEAAPGSADPAIAARGLLFLGQRQERTENQLAGMTFDPEGRRAVVPASYADLYPEIWTLSSFPWEAK